MSPPLPAGHYAGDGHNHGADAGHNHDHGHVHGANESPDEHLNHMQERQSARGTATLEEFHQAAQDTARLREGRPPESARPTENRQAAASGREASQARSENREAASARQRPSAFQQAEPQAGNARLFSPAGAASTALFRAMSGFSPSLPMPQPRSSQASPTNSDGGASRSLGGSMQGREATRNGGTAVVHETNGAEEHSVGLIKDFHAALSAALLSTKQADLVKQVPAAVSRALSALAEEAVRNPELFRALPASLQQMIARYSGISPKLIQVWLGGLGSQTAVTGSGPHLSPLAMLTSIGSRGGFSGSEAPIRGLAWVMGSLGYSVPLLPRLSAGLIQRLEKALLQFLRLFFAKHAGGKEIEENLSRDEFLMQQLAALVAEKERRSKERGRAKKKAVAEELVSGKEDSNFSDDDSDDGGSYASDDETAESCA